MDRQTELALIERCLEQISNKAPQLGERETLSPVTRYTSQARFERERERVLRRAAAPLVHSSELPRPGSYVTRSYAGLPLLIARDAEGTARAFVNVCRHRGAQLVAESGCSNRWRCPYHGWTYGSDGALVGVPHQRGFPELDRATHALRSVPAHEAHGFVWIVADASADAGDARVRGVVADELAALEIGSLSLYGAVRQRWNANWKLLIEGGLEAYHFRATHASTVFPMFHDTLGIYDFIGDDVRGVLPKRSMVELRDAPRDSWRLREHGNTLYTLFPCHSILVQPDHVAWIASCPLGPSVTETVIAMLIPELPRDDSAARHWRANHALLVDALAEDFAMGESIQRGLDSGANDALRFGRFESALDELNRRIERRLDL